VVPLDELRRLIHCATRVVISKLILAQAFSTSQKVYTYLGLDSFYLGTIACWLAPPGNLWQIFFAFPELRN
jgi:hypothetical protein